MKVYGVFQWYYDLVTSPIGDAKMLVCLFFDEEKALNFASTKSEEAVVAKRPERFLVRRIAMQDELPVEWVVTEGNDENITDDGEFGVKINDAAYFYYKDSYALPCGEEVKFRPVRKREFGEVIRSTKD